MQFKDLKKSLVNEVKNVYILNCGKDNEDLFLKASCINNIKNKVLNEFIDINFSVFNNENLEANNLKKSLETLPFMSEKRLVLIKENTGYKDEKVLKVLKDYLSNLNKSTVLIIDTAENSYFTPLFTDSNVVLVDCSRLDKEILENYILKTCKTNSLEIDKSAINRLIDFTDGYIGNIETELNKLINLKKDFKIIRSEDIEENCVKSDEYQIYELTNALFNKNAERALYIVDDIIKNKKNINGILTLIYSQIRKLFYVKVTKNSVENLAKMLEIKPYAVKKTQEIANNISGKKLKNMLVLCKDIDYKIKSGNLDLINGIYNLVFTILI